MSKIRVLVVDDSAFMRKMISDIIKKDISLELVGTARNGKDALIKLFKLKPDVITLDIEMPEMNGLDALEQIMTLQPTPTIMLSSLTQAGADITIKALTKGAVDFVQKPGGSISLNINDVEKEIVNKIKVAALVNFQHLTNTRINEVPNRASKKLPFKEENIKTNFPLVLIGTSTGGPKALHKVIENLTVPVNAAILIVQHMPGGFTKSLAQRLDTLSNIRVKEGEIGEKIKPGFAYVAPGDYQMEVKRDNSGELFLDINQGPLVTGHRPSVDALFNSVAKLGIGRAVAVIMTGMGYDGREGMTNLKKNGCITIAEAKETCVVYGMPKAAIESGSIDKIVPLFNIHNEILQGLNKI